VAVGTYLSKSEKETKKLAGALLEKHRDTLQKKALLFALRGELGAGKTVFAKGVGEYLGVKRPIRSPGFVLVAEYPFTLGKKRGTLFHVDLWRIEDENEARALGIEEMIKPGNSILIEWAQKVQTFIDELRQRDDLKAILIDFAHKGKNKREIKITNG